MNSSKHDYKEILDIFAIISFLIITFCVETQINDDTDSCKKTL